MKRELAEFLEDLGGGVVFRATDDNGDGVDIAAVFTPSEDDEPLVRFEVPKGERAREVFVSISSRELRLLADLLDEMKAALSEED